MTENELAKEAVDIAYQIHTILGPGLLESVYESAFVFELMQRNIQFERQKKLPVIYKDHILDVGFRTDIILEKKLILEIKSVEQVNELHHKIILNYLKLTRMKLGLMINFNVLFIKNGIYRKINGILE